MSYLNRTVAALGFAVATAASAQSSADMVAHTPKSPDPTMIMPDASERVGTSAPIKATREGAVFTTKIHDGPMAGQTIKLNTAKDEVAVTTGQGVPAPITSQQSMIPYPKDVHGPIFASGSYMTQDSLKASCTVEKTSVVIKAGPRDPSPENIKYDITCKTNLGNAFLSIAPASAQGTYLYRVGHAIEADAETGQIQLRILNNIKQFSYDAK